MMFGTELCPVVLKGNRIVPSLLVALGVAFCSATATAAPIVTTPQTTSFSLSLSETSFLGNQSTDSTGSFQQFDPTLGTLQEVVFKVQGRTTGSITFDSADPDDTNRTLGISTEIAVPDLNGGEYLFVQGSNATVLPDETSASIDTPGSSSASFTDPNDLAFFIGTGSFSTRRTLSVNVTADNSSATMFANWDVSLLSLEYVYQARTTGQAPEPGVLFLGSLAAIAAGVAGRRKGKAPH